MKYKEYFKKSQKIRKKIEKTDIPKKLKKYYETGSWPKPIGKGRANIIYPLGNSGGLFVAYRTATGDLKEQFELNKRTFELAQKYFEYYCRKSAEYIEKGKRAPAFNVGVIYENGSNKYAGLLTEDFTKGGRYEVENITDDEYGMLKKDDSKEKVYYDLDNSEYIKLDLKDLKFMSEDAVIHI